MPEQLFEVALGIRNPWFVRAVALDEQAGVPKIPADFAPGSRFAIAGEEGTHLVHDTATKTSRYRKFFPHECLLEVPTPLMRSGEAASMREAEAPVTGDMPRFTLPFQAPRSRAAAWSQSGRTNNYREAASGLFRAAGHRARGFVRTNTIRNVIFLIAGKPGYTFAGGLVRSPT